MTAETSGRVARFKPVAAVYTHDMPSMWWIWIPAGLVLLAVEIHQQAFYALFVAIAAFAAAIVDLAGFSIWIQAVTFAAVGLGGVAAIRPLTVRRLHHPDDQLRLPGIFGGFVGQPALALDEIGDEHHPGHAKIAGETYLAVTDGPSPLAAATKVIVAGVRGSTLLVRADDSG